LTIAPAPVLRTVTFGDLEGGPWGAVWCGAEAIVMLGGAPPTAARPLADGAVEGTGEKEDWRLVADGLELVVAGAAEPVHSSAADGGSDGFDQLCRISGTARLDGAEVAVECLGRRGTRSAVELSRYQSIRDVSAWFEPGEGIALTALRPRKARGHSKDVVVGAVLDAGGGKPVSEPRLSTTYSADGIPSQAGLELWLDGEESDQYPRRAAGESLGVGTAAADGRLELRAELFHWHSRGRNGTGVYLLAWPR
jgi:hypothetical protein